VVYFEVNEGGVAIMLQVGKPKLSLGCELATIAAVAMGTIRVYASYSRAVRRASGDDRFSAPSLLDGVDCFATATMLSSWIPYRETRSTPLEESMFR
jgi:hypothetical protein